MEKNKTTEFKTYDIITHAILVAIGVVSMFGWLVAFLQNEDMRGLVNLLIFWTGACFWKSFEYFYRMFKTPL